MVAIYDLETSVGTSYGRKASPFNPDNIIVAAGWALCPLAKEVNHYYNNGEGGVEVSNPTWFRDLLFDKEKKKIRSYLIGQNIKFDILWALRDPENYKWFKRWVVAGGQIWDTMTAEYLINGMTQDNQFVSMDELARRYGGNAKLSEVAVLWGEGVLTEDIPENLLVDYLVGYDDENGKHNLGDIGNTALIARSQMKRVRDDGNIQLNSLKLNMEAQIGITEMELNGVYCDVKLGYETAAALKQKLEDVEVELLEFIRDVPEEVGFSWTPHQLSAVLFGGKMSYKLNEHIHIDGVPQYAQTTIDEPVLDAEGNPEVYKSGKKEGQVKTKKVKVDDLTRPKMKLQEYFHHCEGYVAPLEKWETKSEGIYQTNADVIEYLGVNYDIPFIKLLQQRASWHKDLTTYYISQDSKGNDKGMLTMVHPDGIIHHTINNVGTKTGRFSSSKPNMQNIPRKDKSDVKYMFKSRFDDGYIVQSDFSSLEIYMQAVLVRPKKLIEILNDGIDVHCYNLAYQLDEPYQDVLNKAKGLNGVAEVKSYDEGRTDAKTISFQLAYGAGINGIAAGMGKPVEEVKDFVDSYYEMYPEINPFFDDMADKINKSAYSTGRYAPHPDFLSVTCDYKRGHHRTFDGKLYSWDQVPAPSFVIEKLGVFQTFVVPEIKNYCIQGMGAEWAKAAVAVAIKEFYKRDNFGGKALLINQVHDAMYLDAEASVVNEAAALLHVCMEKANDYIEKLFKIELPVRVPTETSIGRSMADEEKPSEEFWRFVEQFRKEVQV